jgi:DNA-binding NtrC family response regulator
LHIVGFVPGEGPSRPLHDFILVVDDDADFGAVLIELLESSGYRARLATTIDDFGAALDENPPQLVLLDWFMPEGDTGELARVCHERGIPVVLSSAASDAEARGQAIGAAGVLAKPFDIDTFFRLIERVLGAAPPAPAPSHS